MSDEGKIEYLKRAAKLAVDRLGTKDTLSIVEYDDQITVMWPARRVGNLGEVKAMIDRLDPRGSTNLAGGMMRGVEEAKDALDGPAKRRRHDHPRHPDVGRPCQYRHHRSRRDRPSRPRRQEATACASPRWASAATTMKT